MPEHARSLKNETHEHSPRKTLANIFAALEERMRVGPDKVAEFLTRITQKSSDGIPGTTEKTYEDVVKASLVGAGVAAADAIWFARCAQSFRHRPDALLIVVDEVCKQRPRPRRRSSGNKRSPEGSTPITWGGESIYQREFKRRILNILLSLFETGEYPDGVPRSVVVREVARFVKLEPSALYAKVHTTFTSPVIARRVENVYSRRHDEEPRYRIRAIYK
jgi:hypothetical protein